MPRQRRSAPPHKFRTWLKCLELESRVTPSRPLPLPVIYVGAEAGSTPIVKAYDAETGKLTFQRNVFEASFTGGVRVATADFNRDGYPDLVVGAGPGGGPRVRILDGKTGVQINDNLGDFYAFHPSFQGGVEVAAGDVTGDNVPDLMVGAGKGGGPHVRVFDGVTGKTIMNFFAFDPDFRGGVSLAAADFTGDGKAELVVGAGPGGGPHVKVFDVATGKTIPGPLGNFFAYDESFRGGVNVGTDWKTGDVTGDGRADLITGPGAGHAPTVHVYEGKTGQFDRAFAAFNVSMTAGVRVASAFVTDDEYADVVVATGKGVPNEVRVFDGKDKTQIAGDLGTYTPFGQSTNGLTLTASNDPPNQYGFYDLPVHEHFPPAGQLIPVHITPSANHFDIDQTVDYTSDGKRLRWDIVLTNTGLASEGDFGFTDFGVSYFRLETHVTDGITIINNENGWYGNLAIDMGGSSGNYLTWTGTNPIYVNDSVLLSFETPLITTPIQGSSLAASFPLGTGGPYDEAQTVNQAVVPGLVPKGDIDIIDSKGNVVAENLETNPGGWVSLNNDNDNYNFVGDQATSLVHKYDYSENEKVDGENDLVRIFIHDLFVPDGMTGSFSVKWSLPEIRVWRTSDKDGEYISGTAISSTSTTYLWVEGIVASASMYDIDIKLEWHDAPTGVSKVTDMTKFTVYEVNGPMNVPGYSQYDYTCTVPMDAQHLVPVVSNILHGTLKEATTSIVPGFAPVTTAKILWGTGPSFGTYRFAPDQSLNNFYANREVNVVQVSIETTPGVNNQIAYATGANGPWQPVVGNIAINSAADDKDAVFADLRVNFFQGPVVNNKMRGVRFVEFGDIQIATFTKVHSEFGFAPPMRSTFPYEGVTMLDLSGKGETNPPWYFPGEGKTVDGTLKRGYYSAGIDPQANSPVTNITISMTDAPKLPGSDLMFLGVNNVVKPVMRFDILFTCQIYLAVRTKEAVNGSNTTFTQRAVANWYFNGSGSVDESNGKWLKTNEATNGGDTSFIEIRTGLVVPHTASPFVPYVNQILHSPNVLDAWIHAPRP